MPKAMTEEYMKEVEDAFVSATERCEKAGCKCIHSTPRHSFSTYVTSILLTAFNPTSISLHHYIFVYILIFTVDFVEVHGAHGYLLHQFCSPLTNARTDQYGGSLANRISYPLRIFERVRQVWDPKKPLFYRISATDWAETPERMESEEGEGWLQWGPEQNKVLVGELMKLGVDFIDVSTGGNWAGQKIPVGTNYQVRNFRFFQVEKRIQYS